MFYARPSRSHAVNLPFFRRDSQHKGPTGVRLVARERYRGWQLQVEQSRVGVTLTRTQFSIRLSDPVARREEYLPGFSRRSTAEQAARRRVDYLIDVHDPHTQRMQQQRRAAHIRRQNSRHEK